MNDLFQLAPDDQKPKILKLLEIWERGQTFPRDMLAGFKQQLAKAKTSKDPSPFCGPSVCLRIYKARINAIGINARLPAFGLFILAWRRVCVDL